jgi:hypothetical protein
MKKTLLFVALFSVMGVSAAVQADPGNRQENRRDAREEAREARRQGRRNAREARREARQEVREARREAREAAHGDDARQPAASEASH